MNFIMVVDILSSIYIYNIYVYTYTYIWCPIILYYTILFWFHFILYSIHILLDHITYWRRYIYIQIYCFLSKLGWLKHEPSPYDSKHRGEPVDLHPWKGAAFAWKPSREFGFAVSSCKVLFLQVWMLKRIVKTVGLWNLGTLIGRVQNPQENSGPPGEIGNIQQDFIVLYAHFALIIL